MSKTYDFAPVDATLNISMEQAAVTAALDAGQYVTLTQYPLTSPASPLAWVAVPPALSIVISWTGDQYFLVTETTPVVGAVISTAGTTQTPATLGGNYWYRGTDGFVYESSLGQYSSEIVVVNIGGASFNLGLAQDVTVNGTSSFLATCALPISATGGADFLFTNSFQLFLSTYETGTVFDKIPSTAYQLPFTVDQSTTLEIGYNAETGKFYQVK